MTEEPKWISKDALLLLHSESLAQFGGSMGIRDEGLFDSALAKAQNRFAYENETDVAVLAAAYGYGIAKNHPFIDGNKRAAFAAVGLFLGLNGYRLTASPASAIEAVFAMASGEWNETRFAEWIGEHISAR